MATLTPNCVLNKIIKWTGQSLPHIYQSEIEMR